MAMPTPLPPRLIGYELLEQKAKLVTDRRPAELQHERPFLIATAFVPADAAKLTRQPAVYFFLLFQLLFICRFAALRHPAESGRYSSL